MSIKTPPVVSVIMGSDSDLPKMSSACQILQDFDVSFECTIVSAHRTPERLFEYAKTLQGRGIKIVIAGAGGAAHLPGMIASLTPLPVIGVPIALNNFSGLDSLLSIVQMPKGVPVACMAVDGATNAGILGISDEEIQEMVSEQLNKSRSDVEQVIEKLNATGWENYVK